MDCPAGPDPGDRDAPGAAMTAMNRDLAAGGLARTVACFREQSDPRVNPTPENPQDTP